ncbi:MAG: universal stress protein [Cyclobacteriaceae bacterium]
MMKNNPIQTYKVAMVGLDLTEMDDHLIRYAAAISKLLLLDRVIFVHVAKDLQLPDALIAKYPDLVEPLDESIENDIKAKVAEHFHDVDTTTDCIVKDGHPIEQILKLSKIKNVDLIMMGRKKSLDGSGIMSSKIARKCPCSILFVTSEANAHIHKILLPVDFSHHASLAIDLAHVINERSPAEVRLINFYQVPIGYYKTGKSHEEFADIMKDFAKKDFQRFVANNQFPEDFKCDFLLSDNGDLPQLTYEYAEEQSMDLIIIGSRGRTGIASILMGSIAEKLVYLDSNVPILIVKEKGENMGFLDALMKI